MTAFGLCNYLNIVCYGDFHIKTKEQPCGFVFFKPGTDYRNFGGSSVYAFDVAYKTCDDFTRFVAKHNLENYSVSSIANISRFVYYRDIMVDIVHNEVIFE